MRKLVILLSLTILSCGPSEAEIQNRIDQAVNEATSQPLQLQQQLKKKCQKMFFELPYKHTYLEFDSCSDYLGSENKVNCILEVFIVNTFEFNGSITNIEFLDNYLFVVLKNGKIIKFDLSDNSSEEVFNISNNVRQKGMENGLLEPCYKSLPIRICYFLCKP